MVDLRLRLLLTGKTVHREYITESYHKLIGQVGVRLVGGICTKATGLIMLIRCFSRFRLSIPNLWHQFGKS